MISEEDLIELINLSHLSSDGLTFRFAGDTQPCVTLDFHISYSDSVSKPTRSLKSRSNGSSEGS